MGGKNKKIKKWKDNCFPEGLSERERERERQTDRERDRQREREKERERLSGCGRVYECLCVSIRG